MKKQLLTIFLVMLAFVSFGQQWIAINGDGPSTYKVELVSSSERNITVDLQLNGFITNEVTTPRGQANIVTIPKAAITSVAGEPQLPMIAIPAIIGDRALMLVQVVSSEYTDYENMEIAPSKGDFPRSINPEDVPYTYGAAYSTDAFFPTQLATLDEPYIHRDVRGQNMMVTPVQYNPVTKVMRVYHHLVLSLEKVGDDNRNIIENRNRSFVLDPEFKAIYQNRYINYTESMSRYTPIEEAGELLIICHDAFMSNMQDFVNWKKQIGRPTTMVGTSTAGTTAAAIQSYIQTYYNEHPALTDVLLVGDVAQVPGVYVSAGSGYYGYSGYGDLPYGQTAGNDSYNELLVGRFCCETAAQVTNHVNKVINYERDLNATATWLPIGQGISTTAGTGGHFNEDDYQHIDNIRDDLLDYNYTNVYRDYQNVSGTTASSASVVSQHINSGVSIINYCNHGSETSWGVFSYSNSHVNALTNDYKLPYIISVACLVGKYDYSGGCFAEAWMRATNNSNGNPTGAIGGMFSYISQPWVPPMYGQDEMVDILVESYNNQIRRTMGGVSINGNMAVLDQGATQNAVKGTYNCWILFGDPTLTLRNAIPDDMGVTHAPTMSTTATSFTVNAANGNNALATLTRNNEILGSAIITNGTCNITFDAPGTTGTATLTVFGYNKITYIATINIVSGGVTEYTVNVTAEPEEGGNIEGGGTFQEGQSCTVVATPAANYSFTNWTENGIVVSTNANYTFTVTGNRNLVANFTANPQDHTITVSANPTNGGTVEGGGTYQEGQSCTVVATPAANYTFTNWTENGTVVSTNASYTFTVNANRTLVANFTYVPPTYTINVTANPTNGGNVTGGGTFQQGQSCTVVATPAANYHFTNWTENGTVVSTNASYAFTVNANRTLVAHFTYVPPTYTITVAANPTNGGNVTGGGTFQQGQSCTVVATPAANYNFTNWTENGNVVSTNANYSFTVNSNRTLVANFQEIPCEAPSNLTASVAENTITLAWEASPTAVRYRIYRDDLCIANDITALTYTDTNLEFDHQYCYYVTSMCSNGTMSVPTDEVCATTENFDCEAPTNVTAEAINYTDIRINWSASPTAQSYKIYRNGTLVTSGYPYVGGYYDTELHFGEYCYTVVAECGYGDSEPSEEACAELTLCDPAGDFTAEYVYENEDNYGVRLTWKLVASAFPEYFHLYKLNETTEYELIADIPPAGMTYSYFDNVETGTYSYMLTAEYQFGPEHCISEPVYASCEVTNLNEANATVAIYPNPTQGEVTLEGEGINTVRIMNVYGQTVYNAKVEGDQVRIDLSGMAKGVYMMHIGTENGNAVRQIVVE